MQAASDGHADIVELLLSAGANIEAAEKVILMIHYCIVTSFFLMRHSYFFYYLLLLNNVLFPKEMLMFRNLRLIFVYLK